MREKLISNLGRAAARVSRAPSADFIEKTLKSTRLVILKLGQPKLADGNLQLFCVQNSFQKWKKLSGKYLNNLDKIRVYESKINSSLFLIHFQTSPQ